MRLSRLAFSLAFGSSLVALGCASRASGTSANEAVSSGSDGAETEGNVEALSSSFISGSGAGTGALSLAGDLELSPPTGDIRPQGIGDAAKAFYLPQGCLVVTVDAAKSQAIYAFNDCTGPYGLVHITGNVVVGYSSSGLTQLSLTYAAAGLKINGATVDWSATANITASISSRDMVWDGKFSGTTGHGRAIQRTNHKEYKWTVGVPCLSVSGTSDGTVTGHDLHVDVIGYSRCVGACPASGSEIKITDVTANKIYDLKYATNEATYTEPTGQSVTFTPWCAY